MISDSKIVKSVQKKQNRLGVGYILALALIFVLALIFSLVQSRVQDQQREAGNKIRVAGRQQELMQKLALTGLELDETLTQTHRLATSKKLSQTLNNWQKTFPKVDKLLASENGDLLEFIKYRAKIIEQGKAVQKALTSNYIFASVQVEIQIMLKNATAYSAQMQQLVNNYHEITREKSQQLTRYRHFFLVLLFLLILSEILLLFWPTTLNLNKTVKALTGSEKNAQKMAKELGELYGSLEKSYEKISHINLPVENPKLFAKTDRGGNLKLVSDLFCEISGRQKESIKGSIANMFSPESEDDFMDEIIDEVANGRNWSKSLRFIAFDGSFRWVKLYLSPIFNADHEVSELILSGSNLTQQKLAEQDMQQKDRAQIEKRINEQKFRSVLILEGQEEERKRIAMNIHDGIGQLLTSLKFQMEALGPYEANGLKTKLKDINSLLKEIIREVRRVTFNLKPPVLSDYGLAAGIKNFIHEINKLNDIDLEFENADDFQSRLPSKIENNVFRIVQEAINNAIKYSEADLVKVTLSLSGNNLLIQIADEGKGFDEKLLETRKLRIESGHGFFNMYERTEYVNGNLQISTASGKGTIVKLFVPLETRLQTFYG